MGTKKEITADDSTTLSPSTLRDLMYELAPEAYRDGVLDQERLLAELGISPSGDGERFGIVWPGRAGAYNRVKPAAAGTLAPVPELSLNGCAANLVVEGDNLEVMRSLQRAYFASFKVVYFDPPYNIGDDFVYPDDDSEPIASYLRMKEEWSRDPGSVKRVSATDGRLHSKWLNMMVPRLFLARNLLRRDGVIFVSVDDHEVAHLRMVMDEIFGEENFLCCFVWEKRYSPPPDTKNVGYVHDCILAYQRSASFHAGVLPMSDEQKARYQNPDNDRRGPWKSMDYTSRYTADERPNLYYPVTNPNTREEIWPKRSRVWAYSKAEHAKNEREKRIWWGVDGRNSVPALKNFLVDIRQGRMAMSLLPHKEVGHTDEATKELRSFFPECKITPKPTRLLKQLLKIADVGDGDLVLDAFAGTGTMAQAVVDLAIEDGKAANFVMIELPLPVPSPPNETMVGLARQRSAAVISAARHAALEKWGAKPGFVYLALAESNFLRWHAVPHARGVSGLSEQLRLYAEQIKTGATDASLLAEIMLLCGVPLSATVKHKTCDAGALHWLPEQSLVISAARDVTPALISEIEGVRPGRAIILDSALHGKDDVRLSLQARFKEQRIALQVI